MGIQKVQAREGIWKYWVGQPGSMEACCCCFCAIRKRGNIWKWLYYMVLGLLCVSLGTNDDSHIVWASWKRVLVVFLQHNGNSPMVVCGREAAVAKLVALSQYLILGAAAPTIRFRINVHINNVTNESGLVWKELVEEAWQEEGCDLSVLV